MTASRLWRRVATAAIVILALYAAWRAEPSPQNSSTLAHFLHALLFGWVGFVQRVLPQWSVAAAPVAFTLFVATIAWALLCVFGKRWQGWSWRTPLVLLGTPAVLFMIILSAGGIQARVTEIGPDLQLYPYYRPLRLPLELFEVTFDRAPSIDRRSPPVNRHE